MKDHPEESQSSFREEEESAQHIYVQTTENNVVEGNIYVGFSNSEKAFRHLIVSSKN